MLNTQSSLLNRIKHILFTKLQFIQVYLNCTRMHADFMFMVGLGAGGLFRIKLDLDHVERLF